MKTCNGIFVVKIGAGTPPVARLRTATIALAFDAPQLLRSLVNQQRFIAGVIACDGCPLVCADGALPTDCKKLMHMRRYLTEAVDIPSAELKNRIAKCTETLSYSSDVTPIVRDMQAVFDAVTRFSQRYVRGAPTNGEKHPIELSIFTHRERTLRRIAELFNQLYPHGRPSALSNADVEREIADRLVGATGRNYGSSIKRVRSRLGGDWPRI